MLIGTIGNVRTGKTLWLTKCTTNLANIPENKDKGFECFSNFHINDPRVKYISVNDFINLELDELNSGHVALQEVWSWLYSRLSGSEISRGINPIILQSGKRGFDIQWDSQLGSTIDKTIRLLTEKFWVTRDPLKTTTNKKFHQGIVAFRYVYSTSKVMYRYNMPLRTRDKVTGKEIPVAERYFSLYDTKERADLLYTKNKNKDKEPEPKSEPKQEEVKPVIEPFTKEEKVKLNVEQPFNSEQPQTLIPPQYTKVDTPLNPINVDKVIKENMQQGKQIKIINVDPIEISSYSKSEKRLSGIEDKLEKDIEQ